MENKLNINNLRTFVEALNKLPSEVKNNEVDMQSMTEPICGTTGCHAGLISIVAKYIPELESLYPQDYDYNYFAWADALAEFLGLDDGKILESWAHYNPELWGNYYGCGIFVNGRAFGQETDKFKHSVIINHWTEVLKRVEELNDKGEIQNEYKQK